MNAAPETEVIIPPGTVVLDKYRVDCELGVGGMGLVVKAIHTALGTPVAIKFLLPQYTVSHEAGRRFIREAQAASKIASEHIVRVFDTGSSHPYGPYIVMEFLSGNDLAKHLRETGAFTIDAAIDFTVQAALALAEAHAMGVVHRDIKPANLFLVEQQNGMPLIKVLDFGISKVIEQTSLEVTKTTAILGSGLYMSPEQMKSSKTVDHRTDVYALGVSLFELLTRTQPFTAESFAELAIKVNMEPPTSLRSLRPDVPEALAQAIEIAYAKKVDDRYQTVGEFAAALAPWASPRTMLNIEALARREMRRSIGSRPRQRLSSAPGVDGAAPAPPLGPRGSKPSFAAHEGLFESQMKIPKPPSLPSPSSVGMDTFGLSKKAPDSLMKTAEQSFAVPDEPDKRGIGALSIGIGVGAVLALGTAAFFLLRSPPVTVDDIGIPLPKTASADVKSSTSGARSNEVIVAPTSATPTGAAPGTSPIAASAQKTGATAPSSKSTGTSGSTATAASTTVPSAATTHASAPPPPDNGQPPCKIRDLNGELIDCPK